MIGDRRPYLAALLVPDRETLPVWSASRGIDTDGDGEALVARPEVAAEVERAVGEADARFSRAGRHRLLPVSGAPTPVS